MENKKNIFRKHPIVSVLVLGFIAFYIVMRGINYYPKIENMGGGYSNDQIALQLTKEADGIFGYLTKNSQRYPIEAKQTQLGKVEGIYIDSEKSYPFILTQPLWQLLLPSKYERTSLSAAGKDIELKRPGSTSLDLTGGWSAFGGTLKVESDEQGALNGLFKNDLGDKRFLVFRRIGTQITGMYRTDEGTHPLTGEYIYKFGYLILNINGKKYRFGREEKLKGEVASFGDRMRSYDGIFEYEKYGLVISQRQIYSADRNKITHICEGYLRQENDIRPILACGLDPGRLWINYQTGDKDYADFGTAYAKHTATGIDIDFRGRHQLKRVRAPLLAGQYASENDLITIKLNNLDEGIWSGSLKLAKATFPFKGRFTANNLEAVYLDDQGKTRQFVLASAIVTAILTMDGLKPITLNVTHKAPMQPHNDADLKAIDEALEQHVVNIAE